LERWRGETEQKQNPILHALDHATDFQRASAALEGGKGPVAAFGLPAPHKGHLAAILGAKRTVLLVTATDTAAAAFAENIRLFGLSAQPFLPRETPLVHVCAVSGPRYIDRIAALTALVNGAPMVVAASAAALMQVLAPK